jgi:hypothetical protein
MDGKAGSALKRNMQSHACYFSELEEQASFFHRNKIEELDRKSLSPKTILVVKRNLLHLHDFPQILSRSLGYF